MKKVSTSALLAGVVALAATGQANAAHQSAHIQKAQQLRASAKALNHQASQVEYQIRCLIAEGKHSVHLRQKARQMRRKAITLAQMSNRMMRSGFGGRKRPQRIQRTQAVQRAVYRPAQRHVVQQRVYHQQPVQRVVHRVAQPVQRVVYHAPQAVQRFHYQQPQRVVRYVEPDQGRSERILQNIIQPVLGLAVHHLHNREQRRQQRAMRQHRRNLNHRAHFRGGSQLNRSHRQHRMHGRSHGGQGHRMMQHSMQASYRHGQKFH